MYSQKPEVTLPLHAMEKEDVSSVQGLLVNEERSSERDNPPARAFHLSIPGTAVWFFALDL